VCACVCVCVSVKHTHARAVVQSFRTKFLFDSFFNQSFPFSNHFKFFSSILPIEAINELCSKKEVSFTLFEMVDSSLTLFIYLPRAETLFSFLFLYLFLFSLLLSPKGQNNVLIKDWFLLTMGYCIIWLSISNLKTKKKHPRLISRFEYLWLCKEQYFVFWSKFISTVSTMSYWLF
jgi:hypothetical protein